MENAIIVAIIILLVILAVSLVGYQLKKKTMHDAAGTRAKETAEPASVTETAKENKPKKDPSPPAVKEDDPEERARRLRESDIRYMREAGVPEEDLPDMEVIYDTGSGYSGVLITYHKKKRQFYSRNYYWHIDDSQEFTGTGECTAQQAADMIESCCHKRENKAPALRRISELTQ